MALACLGVGYFVYIVQNLRVSPPPAPTVAPTSLTASTPTPFLFAQPTETPPPTLEATIPLLPIPSPVPGFFGDTPPTGKIAFACYVKQIDQICLINADGTDRRQLTNFDATAFYPSISPDGHMVYFSSKRSGGFEVYSIDTNGNNLQRLTREIGSLYAPELSPNGEWIIFTNNGNGLWLMRPDGKNPRPLTDRDDIDPTWSPDSSMIAFASSRNGARQLLVMNADGTNIRQVTDLDNMGGRSTWSPDGTQILFASNMEGANELFVMDANGANVRRVTNFDSLRGRSDWSPDGGWMVTYNGQPWHREVFIFRPDFSDLRQLTPEGGNSQGPSFSPDGKWVTFTSYFDHYGEDLGCEIYIIRTDGTDLRRLTDNAYCDYQPRWGP